MPAVAQDITHYRGDSATIVIGPVVDEAGAPVNLAGALGARWWMGKSPTATGSDVYLKKATGATQTGEDGSPEDQMDISLSETDKWIITIRILPTDTEAGPTPASLYHECEVVDADGKVSTVTIGKFILKPTLVRNL